MLMDTIVCLYNLPALCPEQMHSTAQNLLFLGDVLASMRTLSSRRVAVNGSAEQCGPKRRQQ